jgi:hypothetical protein
MSDDRYETTGVDLELGVRQSVSAYICRGIKQFQTVMLKQRESYSREDTQSAFGKFVFVRYLENAGTNNSLSRVKCKIIKQFRKTK